MVGTIEAFAGFEKIEGKIKWASFYADVLKKVAHSLKETQLQVCSLMPIIVGSLVSREAAVVVTLLVVFESLTGGTYEWHKNVKLETDFAAYLFS